MLIEDYDPTETQEWIDSLRAVVHHAGPERGAYIPSKLREEARRMGAMPPFLATTPYVNTIAREKEEKSPGNREIEHDIRSAIRWNAVAIILRANKESSELGGHIASEAMLDGHAGPAIARRAASSRRRRGATCCRSPYRGITASSTARPPRVSNRHFATLLADLRRVLV